MAKQLLRFLDETDCLDPFQDRLWHRNCPVALTDQLSVSPAALLSLSGAFQTIGHGSLLKHLSDLGGGQWMSGRA